MAANEDLKNILAPTDIGTFTAPTVTANKPTLTTDPNAAIFKDVSPGYNLTSFGMDPYATSSLYADQLARESGARGLRPDEESLVAAGQTLPTYGPSMPAPPQLTMGATDNESFLEQAYLDVLGRPLGTAGREAYLPQLASGQLSRDEVIAALKASDEYAALGDTQPTTTDNLAFLQQAYQDLLGRPLQAAGQEWYLPQLESGEMTQDQLIANLKASDEYAALNTPTTAYVAPSVSTPAPSVSIPAASTPTTAYAAPSYASSALTPEIAIDLMNRSMTTGVPTSLINQYGGYDAVKAMYEANTPSNMMYNLASVPAEDLASYAQQVQDTGVGNAAAVSASSVAQMYQDVFGRAADPEGMNYYADQITTGAKTPAEVLADLTYAKSQGAMATGGEVSLADYLRSKRYGV